MSFYGYSRHTSAALPLVAHMLPDCSAYQTYPLHSWVWTHGPAALSPGLKIKPSTISFRESIWWHLIRDTSPSYTTKMTISLLLFQSYQSNSAFCYPVSNILIEQLIICSHQQNLSHIRKEGVFYDVFPIDKTMSSPSQVFKKFI